MTMLRWQHCHKKRPPSPKLNGLSAAHPAHAHRQPPVTPRTPHAPTQCKSRMRQRRWQNCIAALDARHHIAHTDLGCFPPNLPWCCILRAGAFFCGLRVTLPIQLKVRPISETRPIPAPGDGHLFLHRGTLHSRAERCIERPIPPHFACHQRR